MGKRPNRYRDMELRFTALLIADAVIFVLFLLASGIGITWLKIFTAIISIILSAGCLLLLFFNGELLRQRSLWMSAGFAAIFVCLIFSLLLKYPSPNKLKDNKYPSNAVGAFTVCTDLETGNR